MGKYSQRPLHGRRIGPSVRQEPADSSQERPDWLRKALMTRARSQAPARVRAANRGAAGVGRSAEEPVAVPLALEVRTLSECRSCLSPQQDNPECTRGGPGLSVTVSMPRVLRFACTRLRPHDDDLEARSLSRRSAARSPARGAVASRAGSGLLSLAEPASHLLRRGSACHPCRGLDLARVKRHSPTLETTVGGGL